jgi:hypothetical protein
MLKLRSAIENRLQVSLIICLIVDIWTNNFGVDFIALSAVTINKFFEKEFFVIDFMRMPGTHNSENIKLAIETMTNKYNFDKSKIRGKT